MSAASQKEPLNSPSNSRAYESDSILTIWVDADSLPKDIRPMLIRRAKAKRTYDGIAILVRFVASRNLPEIPEEYLILVEPSEGAADLYIEAHAEQNDIAITRDILLAERLLARSVHPINDRGDIFTAENMGERRSLRDAMAFMRDSGIAPPSPKGNLRKPSDTKSFADALEKLIVQAVRQKSCTKKID
mgnify:FL=1